MISATPLQAMYAAVRYWEEVIEVINNNRSRKKTFIMTTMFRFTVEQDKENKEYMLLNTHGQMMTDP
jgi:hypothetical protein